MEITEICVAQWTSFAASTRCTVETLDVVNMHTPQAIYCVVVVEMFNADGARQNSVISISIEKCKWGLTPKRIRR